MKSHVRYVYVCVVLMLVASPVVLADIVPDGDTEEGWYGNTGGGPGETSSSASADASGSTPYSIGYANGWHSETTTESGDFYWSWYVSVSASWNAFWGNGGSPSAGGYGGGSASTPGGGYSGSAFSSGSPPSWGSWGDSDDGGIPGGIWDAGGPVHLDAFEGASSSNSTSAVASVEESGANNAHGEGSATAEAYIY